MATALLDRLTHHATSSRPVTKAGASRTAISLYPADQNPIRIARLLRTRHERLDVSRRARGAATLSPIARALTFSVSEGALVAAGLVFARRGFPLTVRVEAEPQHTIVAPTHDGRSLSATISVEATGVNF